MKAFRNIRKYGLADALKEDAIETAKRYPTITISACLLNRCVLGNENNLCGFVITPQGNLKHANEELYYTGEWVKATGEEK